MQNVLTHKGLYKLTTLLDQFCNGLKNSGVYDISSFPKEFFDLFTYTRFNPVNVL